MTRTQAVRPAIGTREGPTIYTINTKMKQKINTIFRSIQAFGELCHWSEAQQDFWYRYLDDFSKRVEHQGLAEAIK